MTPQILGTCWMFRKMAVSFIRLSDERVGQEAQDDANDRKDERGHRICISLAEFVSGAPEAHEANKTGDQRAGCHGNGPDISDGSQKAGSDSGLGLQRPLEPALRQRPPLQVSGRRV